MLAFLFTAAGLFFLVAVAWLWSRNMRNARHRVVWYTAVMTVVLAGVTIVLCVLADQMLDGDEELVIVGTIFMLGAVTLLMWVQVWRHFGRGRAARNEEDGRLDVRCPACGYR